MSKLETRLPDVIFTSEMIGRERKESERERWQTVANFQAHRFEDARIARNVISRRSIKGDAKPMRGVYFDFDDKHFTPIVSSPLVLDIIHE